MKKYKLIKEYPGSPILNTEIKYSGNGWRCHKTDFALYENPDKHPKFWEEIIEKNYEILQFKNKGTILSVVNDKPFSEELLEAHLKNSKIYSVRRLSDGEVFTIGDNTNIGKIQKFDLNNNTISVSPFSEKPCCEIASFNIIQHVKQPLFKTEDGVDIFVGDKYWVLNTKVNNWIFEEKAGRDNINYFYKNKSYAQKTKVYYFSTKEKAEEYILMNKPCLSINDCLKIKTIRFKNDESLSNALKELVKSKL